MVPLRIAVLISGRGSNLQALMSACQDLTYPAEIVAVISNEPEARGIKFAADASLLTHIVVHRHYPSRHEFEKQLTSIMISAGVELICLAGFMRLLSNDFVSLWRDKLINIHPSLLPAFKGLNAQEQAISSGVKFSGCTVHFVREKMDTGPIICQAVVPIHDSDNADTLTKRILQQEHIIYPIAVFWIAKGLLNLTNERTKIKQKTSPTTSMINPNRT